MTEQKNFLDGLLLGIALSADVELAAAFISVGRTAPITD